MNFWITFWTIFFFASLSIFSVMAVIVAIGGYYNIRSLFKLLLAGAQQADNNPDEKQS